MFRLILALTVWSGSAVAQTCLPETTQTCVFQMALQQANAAPKPASLAAGYMAVAFLQEDERTADAATTRTALLVRLLHADPDPAKVDTALSLGLLGLYFSNFPTGHTPETDHWIEVTLADLARQIDPSANAPPKTDTLEDAVDAKVAATPADAVPKYARLRAARLPQRNTLNFYLSLLPAALGKEQSLTLLGLAKKQALTAARSEIRSWPDPAQRAAGLSYLAATLAEVGEVRAALLVLHHPDLADLSVLDAEGLYYVALTHAYAGQADRVVKVLARMERAAAASQRTKLLAIATTVAGDFARARDILQAAGPEDYFVPLLYAIDAYLTAGQGEVDRLVTLLPPRMLPDAIYAIGYHQVEVGDVAAALATYARLMELGTPPSADLRQVLAPLMAGMGHEVKAVAMADALGQAAVTALVAARID